MESRKLEEKKFHDKIRTVKNDLHVTDTRWSPELEHTIKNDPSWANMKYYAVERKSRNFILQWFKDNCVDMDVLDYCCGNGEDGFFIAQNGAKHVTGIDISDISIKNCNHLAKANGVSKKTSYVVQDAEKTEFEDNSFDIITEYGALHHLDFEKSMQELVRIIRPDGKIICNEALGHNPLIHLYRKMTPKLRTAWEVEHIIKKKNFEIVKNYFNNIELHFYHLATLMGVPLRNTKPFPPVLSLLETIDSILLKLPVIKWQAWQIVFIMSSPKK